MFKLKKILGARCNAPEIVEISIMISNEVHAGRFYAFANQMIIDHDGTEHPTVFVPIETAIAYSEVKRIKGYYVTSDMVFEGKVFGDVAFIAPGTCVEAHLNDGNLIDGVGVADGTFAFIDSIDEYEETGNVTFRLNL